MKQNLLSKMMLLMAVLLVGAGTAWATDVTYKLTIDASSFNTTSYAANNNEKTSNAVCVTDNTKTFEVTWTSSQVMKSSTNMQWQKSKGCIYNSTDLGTITGVTVTSSAGSFTTYYGEEEQPSSSTTVGGGFFQIKVGGATGTVSKIEVTFTVSEGGDTNLEESDLALEDSPVELEFDLYNNASPQVINYTTSSTGAVTIAESEYATFSIDAVNKTITVTPTAKTSDTETVTVNQAADETYNAGSTTFTLTITDSAPKTYSWEVTEITDLVDGDVFVIVGDNGNTFALPNNNGADSAPSAVAVTIENGEITSDVTDNIKWNISGNADDGYTFYPNGTTETWLFCNTTASSSSNNNMRVGTGDRKVFALSGDNLVTNDNYTTRYVSIYSNTDWRGYTNANSAPSISFYKYVNNAAVKNPVITVENTFIGSTTAAITCSTDGATIYYSYDNENWTEYTDELNITETTTIYAKAVKNTDESEVVSKTTTKVLPTPTVTVSGDLTVDLDGETDVEAGTLTASVTYNEAAVEGAVVTWSSSNTNVATIDESTGAVTIKARGTVTFTATYAGNSDYAEATGTKTVTVTDSKAPGSEAKPYTVAEAIAAIDASEGTTDVYVRGIVCTGGSSLSSGSMNYWISDDGTETNRFEIYKGKGIGGANFTSTNDVQVGDVVVVYGNLTKYNTTYEFAAGSNLISLVRKVATPTFDPESSEVIAGSTVTISTTTEDATIYYTVDGTEPTTESSVYTDAITINEDVTIKAIAVKDGMNNSNVATATYTIIVTPTIALSTSSIEATAAEAEGSMALTFSNLTISDETDFGVQFYDSEGEETDEPNWVLVEVTEDNGDYVVSYMIEENTSTEARTAYFKVYAMDDETNLVYSNLVTVNQAGFVVDYATLPFEYDGNGTGTLPTGLTVSGTGTYASSPKIKFDGNGDEVVLKLNEEPGMIWFDIKGNSVSGNYSFKLQTSVDGVEYSDLETFDDPRLSTVTTATTYALSLDANVRYIKWVYVTKVNGNVGLGNIIVDKAETVSVGEAGYATYVTKHNVAFPDDVEAYIASEVNTEKGYVSMAQVTAVPKGTPVVLKNEGVFTLAPAATTDNVEDNQLKASDIDFEADGSQYVLAKPQDKEVGFYKADEGSTIAAGKGYLQIAGEAPVKGFTFKFGDDNATAIDNVQCSMFNDQLIYNLAGQRVSKMQRGINIVNGKKVAVK